jgi:hypothetical protein
VDVEGNIYVADYYNNTIRKITPEGVVTTIAGHVGQWGSSDGSGSQARFNGPSGVRIDNDGNILVTDNNNNTIRRVDKNGIVSTIAGSAGKSGTILKLKQYKYYDTNTKLTRI